MPINDKLGFEVRSATACLIDKHPCAILLASSDPKRWYIASIQRINGKVVVQDLWTKESQSIPYDGEIKSLFERFSYHSWETLPKRGDAVELSFPDEVYDLLLKQDQGMTTFQRYSANGGKLSKTDFEAVESFPEDDAPIIKAYHLLRDACHDIDLRIPPTPADIEITSRIMGVLGTRASYSSCGTKPCGVWLLTESYLIQDKDPTPVYESALASFWGRAF